MRKLLVVLAALAIVAPTIQSAMAQTHHRVHHRRHHARHHVRHRPHTPASQYR